MSTSESTVKGKFDELAGKVKQGVGDAFNDQSLANKGAAQEVKGHGEQAVGAVKDGWNKARNTDDTTQSTAHDVRESVTSTAQNVKEHVQAGVDSLTNKR